MPTPIHFSKYPPFPSDPSIPIADIPKISLHKLLIGSDEESSRLYGACRKQGFFFLDLNDSHQGAQLRECGGKMFDLIEKTLTLDQPILERYACDAPRSLIGYKRKGMLRVDDNSRDSIEVDTLSQDDILGNIPPLSNPEPIEASRHDCRDFFHAAFAAVSIILSHLDKHLDLQPGTLAARCALDKPSATSVRMLWSPAQPVKEPRRINFGGHTDIGIITILFNVAGGLQVLPLDQRMWMKIGAIFNLGRAAHLLILQIRLRSGQAQLPRQSLAYLVRAEKRATVQRLKGGNVIPQGEEDDTRNVDSWAAWRAQQIMNGVLKPESRGGQYAVAQ